MTDRSIVRIPTSRLLPAVTAAIDAWGAERWAKADVLIAAEMARPMPTTWWRRLWDTPPAATREEAIERLKVPLAGPPWDRWHAIWYDGEHTIDRLTALRDACEMRQDAVEVVVSDVALFKRWYVAEDGRVWR